MRSDLSFESFAVILAALGASALVACGGGTPQPVHANEVAPAASGMPGAIGHASCSNCGARAAPGPNAASDSPSPAPAPSEPATTAASSSATNAAAAPASVALAPASDSPAPPTKATAKKGTVPPKPPAHKAPPAGEASCGAGTCSGDSKKKIL